MGVPLCHTLRLMRIAEIMFRRASWLYLHPLRISRFLVGGHTYQILQIIHTKNAEEK